MACCSCGSTPIPDNCRVSITGADIAELLYIQGLDENLCKKWQEVADIVGFVDCLGNPIVPGAAIVTCADFPARLCAAIATWAAGAVAVPGVTQLLGDDCLTHTLPTFCDQLTALPSGPAITLGVTEVLTENCQLATVPETPITVVDTISVDLTVGGPFNHTLQADVNISEIANNCLVLQADGLYVACPEDPVNVCEEIQDFPVGAPGVPGVTQFVGSDCELHTLPAATADTIITAIDSDCIDLTILEVTPNNFTIEAEVIISPNADNALSCVGNGLFVNEVELTAGDGDCVTIQVTDNGNGDWEIVADAVISPDFGNALECRENGLYANQVGLIADDSNCIALVLVGDTLTAEPIISPDAGNALECTANGLFVAAGAGATVIGADTTTVDTTVVEAPAGTFTVSSEVIISPNAGNTLIDDGDGLYVSTGSGIAVADTACIDMTLAAGVISAVPILASEYPGYPIAGSNSIECTVNGLAGIPDITTLYESDVDSPADGSIAIATTTLVSSVSATITNTNPYRQMKVMVDFNSPQLSIITAVPSAGTNLHLITDFAAIFPSGVVGGNVHDVAFVGAHAPGNAMVTGSGVLAFSDALLTLDPGESITMTINVSLQNEGDQTEDYNLGNTGVRLFGTTMGV